MDFRYFVLLLLLVSVAYADCTGYNDTFQVRVLDAKGRPIPGAAVTVTFDRGAMGGPQYFTTPVKYTDQNGLLQEGIFNQGTTDRTIDCNIVINATQSGVMESATVVANVHGQYVDVDFSDVYPITFFVRDQLGYPIEKASVTIENQTQLTKQDGSSDFFMPYGNHSFFASYLDAYDAGTIPVIDDTVYVENFTYYTVEVLVRDDFGDPLPATLTIFNQTFQMDNGSFTSGKTFGEAVPYSVDYKGIVTTDTIYPATNPNVVITYDIHSPTISDINASTFEGTPRLTMSIVDPGQSPSGIDFSSIKVRYRLEPADESTPWDSAVAYTTGRNQVTAEFPDLPSDRVVTFVVDAQDKAGNKAEVQGKFTTMPAQAQSNTTQNQTKTQNPPAQSQGLPLLYIILGVIVVVLAVYIVFRMKSKPAGGS